MKKINEEIRVLVADDHPLVLDGICACLETYPHIDVVGTATTGCEALEKAGRVHPDIALLDINMPDLTGLDATAVFKERYPGIKLLILSMHDNREYISSALRFGARGYVLKDVPTEEIVTAIETVHAGNTYFSSGVSEVLSNPTQGGPGDQLTEREQLILSLLAKGNSNKHVARELGISVRTVETHRRNIKQKLSISSTAGLTSYAIRHGLLKEGLP